jgi:hypothetical protein
MFSFILFLDKAELQYMRIGPSFKIVLLVSLSVPVFSGPGRRQKLIFLGQNNLVFIFTFCGKGSNIRVMLLVLFQYPALEAKYLSMALQLFDSWPFFQFINPIHTS